MQVTCIYGHASHTGKTRMAVDLSLAATGKEPFIMEHANGIWFDGYSGQKAIVFDDFYGWIKCSAMLRLLDGYKSRLEYKGGFTWAGYTHVFITSNDAPETWYHNITPQAQCALLRRFNHIIQVDCVLYEDMNLVKDQHGVMLTYNGHARARLDALREEFKEYFANDPNAKLYQQPFFPTPLDLQRHFDDTVDAPDQQPPVVIVLSSDNEESASEDEANHSDSDADHSDASNQARRRKRIRTGKQPASPTPYQMVVDSDCE